MKKFFNKLSYISAAVIVGAAFTANSALISVSAETIVEDYAATSILDDLGDVPVGEYPKDLEGKPEVIRFQEYCFSEKPFFDEFYGLFLYIYNPTEEMIRIDKSNVVNMAVSYDVAGKPDSYENVPLIFCDKTKNNRFYKFELDVDYLSTAKSYAQSHEGERRYDIVGIQLSHQESIDYTYNKTYRFDGYAAGCAIGSDESTLTCTVEGLETITLDVYHTNYLSQLSNNTFDELNTAYFGVSEEYFTDFGGLQKIKAEWYEYKTKKMFVTEDEKAYDALQNYIGRNIGYGDSSLKYQILWDQSYDSTNTEGVVHNYINFGSTYNGFAHNKVTNTDLIYTHYNWAGAVNNTRIDWLFNAGDVKFIEDYKISALEVEEYMRWYTDNIGGPLVNGFSSYLFEDSIDADRLGLLEDPNAKRGHIVQEIDADEDTADLIVQKDQSFWDKLWHGTQYEEKNLEPIIVLTANDLRDISVETFAERYKVNAGDAGKVLSNCKSMLASGQRPVLFRFAVTDYTAKKANFDKTSNLMMDGDNGYVAQMSMFLDFDVISLTFRDELKGDAVIGVVSNPTHIINDIEPPTDMPVDGPGLFDDFGKISDPYRVFKIVLACITILGVAFGVTWIVLKIKYDGWRSLFKFDKNNRE